MNLSWRFSNAVRAKHRIVRAITCCMLLVLPACQIPQLRQSQPTQGLPTGFNVTTESGTPSSGASNAENSAQLGIEEFYNDPALTRLIYQALAGNRELQALNEDVQIARNEILARQGAYLPFIGLRARAELNKPSLFTPEGVVENQLEVLPGKHFPDPLPNIMGGLNLFWQMDIWRELRNARDAAAQRYRAASEKRNYFVTRMIADIAENYYSLMALDRRLATLDSIIKLQEESLKVAMAKKAAARGTELPVQRFQAEVHKNYSEKLIITQDIIETENRINFLLGRFPQPVERVSERFLDLNIHSLSVGVPVQLLQNRPDIRQAERELVAAGIEVKVARAQFFPRVDLLGGVGYQAYSPKFLFTTPESLIAGVAGELVAPLVNKKAIQAQYRNMNAKQLQSLYNYQRVIINAFTEVVNRMSMVENYRKSIEIKRQQVQSLEQSVVSATRLLNNAYPGVDYLDVLFAQRDLMDARMVLIETKKQQLTAVVNVYQALGGGGNMLPVPTQNPPLIHGGTK